MSEIINNNQLDFYHNQINPNQNSQANIVMRRDIREVSFEVDEDFLNSQFNKFLTENFNRILQISQNNQNNEQNNQSINQLYNIFQIMAQEIIKLKNDISEAFSAEGKMIGDINEDKNKQINNICKVWNDENSKNIKDIKLVYDKLNKNDEKFSKELENQSKKLVDSILKNKLENDNIKNEFKILNSNLNFEQNKNDGHERIINSISELCNNNNKKILELEAKLTNLQNNYKNKE